MRWLVLLVPFTVLFLLFSLTAHAQTQGILSSSTQVNLSDAIYADLAVRGYLDNVSIYYADGKSSDDIKLNETRHWLPASTVKTYAAMYAYKLISEDKLNLSDTVTIDAKNDVPTELVTDQLPTLMIGDTVTIDRLIRQMITQSDNTAFNQLLDVFGRDNVTSYIQSLGLAQSHVGSKLNLDDSQTQYEYDVQGYGINSTTAEDYAKAFLLIKNNKIPGAKSLFATLAQQKINNMIPLLLPKTVVCAHKTGDLDPLYHDGGICQDKTHSYVLTIFTNAGDPNLLAHLSEIAYTKDFQLVGQAIANNQPLSESTQQPLDELVMNPPKTTVLGASTSINFPVPDITAADLGVKASDLSLVIPNNKLPKVLIPTDSPLHNLVEDWQIVKYLVAPGPEARMSVYLQAAQLRLAEVKELISRGKNQDGQALLTTLQQDLNTISKDKIIQSNSYDQTAIQAISETRFSLLGNQLNQVKGTAKLTLIKEIASQAKETIQKVQPNIPEAMNATSPTQRPLIGTVVSSTPTTITVQTAGGQQITIPTNTAALKMKEKFSPSPTGNPVSSISQVPSPSQAPTANGLTAGTTVALIGSTVNNHFSPSLILANVPKELAAPEPVTVAKVDVKHNTMVVEENGVYTQVDINKDTTIKGANTNIPITSIQTGDVVVVHGTPLTQTQVQTPTVTSPTPLVTPNNSHSQITPTGKRVIQPTLSPTASELRVSPTLSLSPTTIPTKFPTTSPQNVPQVIQSTSVQIIEKKSDALTSIPNTQPKQQQSQPQPSSHQDQPKSAPPPPQNNSDQNKNNDSEKKK